MHQSAQSKKTTPPTAATRLSSVIKNNAPPADVLLITCAEAVLDDRLLTRLGQHRLLVWRSSAHVIPPYGAGHDVDEQTIDQLVEQMGVGEIIVCGHRPCAALEPVLSYDDRRQAPRPLQFALAARRIVEEKHGPLPREQLLQAMSEENVFVQMTHLRTYPAVLAGLARQKLKLHSWIYDDDKDELYGYGTGHCSFLRRIQGQSKQGGTQLPFLNPCDIYLA